MNFFSMILFVALDEQASGPLGQTGQQHTNNESLPSQDDLNATDRSR